MNPRSMKLNAVHDEYECTSLISRDNLFSLHFSITITSILELTQSCSQGIFRTRLNVLCIYNIPLMGGGYLGPCYMMMNEQIEYTQGN